MVCCAQWALNSGRNLSFKNHGWDMEDGQDAHELRGAGASKWGDSEGAKSNGYILIISLL